jgi:hypothetical protein
MSFNNHQEKERTDIIFNELSDFFSMVNIAVIKDNHATWSRIGIGVWNLDDMSSR